MGKLSSEKWAKAIVLFLLIALILTGIAISFRFLDDENAPLFFGNGSNKIVVIVLDGADWRIINPLIDQNRLPVIKELKEQGSQGELLKGKVFRGGGRGKEAIAKEGSYL